MRFRAAHKTVSYLLTAAAIGCVASSGAVAVPTMLVVIALGVLSWFVEPDTGLGGLLDRAALVFNGGALLFFGLSLYQVVQSFPEPDLSPILNLVLFLVVYKLLQRRTNRDYLQLYILSFLLVLSGAWLAQSVLFVAGFAAYVVLATWTLTLFHLRREIEDNYLIKHTPEAGSEKVTVARVLNSRRVVGRSFFLVTGGVALAVLAGAGVVFTVIPRIGLGFLTVGFRRRLNVVGFSNEVKLGQHGVLSTDNQTVVMRVEMPRLTAMGDDDERDLALTRLYWRGTVYDTYNPKTGEWVKASARGTETKLKPDIGPQTGRIWYTTTPETPKDPRPNFAALAKLEVQNIHVVGLTVPVAFALDRPVAFEAQPRQTAQLMMTEFSGQYGGEVSLRVARARPDGSTEPLSDFNGAHYTVYSRDLMRGTADGKNPSLEDLRPELMAPYVAIPSGLSGRMKALAQTITVGKTIPIAKVQAIVTWLHSNKKYTTDLKRDETIRDPVEDFLFQQAAGHCEYFASSAALLLRLAGVPSRYVNGYLGGEWNGITKHVTVRDNRAHAWAEAYIGRIGWIRLDATPSAGIPARMSSIRQLFDSLERTWSWWIIDYDMTRQVDLARKLGRGVGFKKGTPWQSDFWRQVRWRRLGVGILIAAALWFLFRKGMLRLRRKSPKPTHVRRRGAGAMAKIYETALKKVARQGWLRDLHETPREFARRLHLGHHADAEILGRVTERYNDARYGDREIDEAIIADLAVQVGSMGQARQQHDTSAA